MWLIWAFCIIVFVYTYDILSPVTQKIQKRPKNKNVMICFNLCTCVMACAAVNNKFEDTWNGIEFLYKLPVWLFTSDAMFYFFHRILHTRPMRFIHRTHHNNIIPRRMDAFDMHPVEAFLLFFLVFSTPVVLLSPPLWLSHFILLYFGCLSSLQAHNGPDTFHAVHHNTPHVNYGFKHGIFDRLLSTRLWN